ncbi:MAG: HAMP domain-containing sensor histidine kinase, partial [bacterium]|nr:HAMP domain-containing sensor histidine kinase [bacterium]
TEKFNKEYYVLVPVINETGHNIHSILYVFSRQKEFQFRRFIAIFGFFIYSLLFLVTLVIDNLLMGRFVKNIERLKQVAELVRSGNYSVRSSIKSGDEIMYLSDTVNSMLESMTTYIYNLRAMVEELEARDKARDEILAKISHELRTPLTASKGYVELLLTGNIGNLSEEQRKALEIISRNLNRLEDETRKLLQSSKAAIENIQIKLRVIDVKKVFEEIKENFESEIQKKNLRLVYNFEIDKVCADLEQFHSILENLISNAVKFTPEGGLIEVRTSEEQIGEKSYIKISLFNTSPKIPESELEKIFKPFYQVDNGTKREKGGFGLGLYIIKRAVELHKGFVRALNTENGVKFEVCLPFLEACNEEDFGH